MDTEYLKETVGKSLSEGLAHLAKCRAHDAVEYLGYYLINFVEKANNEIKVQCLNNLFYNYRLVISKVNITIKNQK